MLTWPIGTLGYTCGGRSAEKSVRLVVINVRVFGFGNWKYFGAEGVNANLTVTTARFERDTITHILHLLSLTNNGVVFT